MKLLIPFAAAAIGAAAVMAGTGAARADETVVICKAALASPATAAGCAGVGLIVHELLAERPFGPNGEVMKVLAAPVKLADGNVKGATRESGELAKVVRATVGISVRDIEKYGLWGGPNSIFRKPFG